MSRLEYMAEEPQPTNQKEFILPKKIVNKIVKDVGRVEQYLNELSPLSGDGLALKNAVMSSIALS